MKSTDVLIALEDVDGRYKEEAAEENADRIFKKSEKKGAGLRVFKFVLSGAALFALAAFAVVTVMTKYMNKPDKMVLHGASVNYELSEYTIGHETFKPDGSHESFTDLKLDGCALQGGEPQEANVKKPDYLMSGGSHMFKTYYDYTAKGAENRIDVIKSKNGTEVWRYTWSRDENDGLQYESVRPLDSGVLLTANDYIGFTDKPHTLEMIMLDDNGYELWNRKYDHPVGRIAGVYYDADTVYVAGYTHRDNRELKEDGIDWIVSDTMTSVNISEYDRTTGELKKHGEIPVQIDFLSESVRCIGKTEYGYVLTYYSLDNVTRLLLVSDTGVRSLVSFADTYEFGSASSFNGKIYLSGKHMSPERNMGADAYFYLREWDYFYLKYSYIFDRSGIEENNEFLSKYKEETSAVLLVCDGFLFPEQIYTQNKAFGGALNKTENGLEWDVAEISAAFGGFNEQNWAEPIVAGSSRTYTFGEEGLITSAKETGRSYAMIGVYYPYE